MPFQELFRRIEEQEKRQEEIQKEKKGYEIVNLQDKYEKALECVIGRTNETEFAGWKKIGNYRKKNMPSC